MIIRARDPLVLEALDAITDWCAGDTLDEEVDPLDSDILFIALMLRIAIESNQRDLLAPLVAGAEVTAEVFTRHVMDMSKEGTEQNDE